VADVIVVDVMFNACGETIETLSRYAEIIDLDGILRCAHCLSQDCCAPSRLCGIKDVMDEISAGRKQ